MIFAVFFLLFARFAYADMFAIENPDKSIEIINSVYLDKFEKNLKENGQFGYPIKRITKDDLPSREDRAFWRLNDIPGGEKIVVDESEKLKAQQDKDKSILDKENARKKICPSCSDDDFRKAFGD